MAEIGKEWYILDMAFPSWTKKTWPLCLKEPPQIAQIGIGIHGRQRIERYQLPDLWCLHLYRYEADVLIGAEEFPIRPGFASIIPADTPMTYHFRGRSTHLYVHFRIAVSADEGERRPVPAMQDLGDDFGRLYAQMEAVISSDPQRTQARLWDILWQLTERYVPDSAAGPAAHPAVRLALQSIERHLAEPLRVTALAEIAGVSDRYLGRLFQDALGMTVVGYLRHRRVQRAEHLLRHSTLPIKTIAALVGLPDLHQFNKTIHRVLGQSPRAVRQTALAINPDQALRDE